LLNLIYNIFRPSVKTQIQKPLENELELRKKILEIYSDSNRELDRITDADLKKYNYY
jgi:hypothetical protein